MLSNLTNYDRVLEKYFSSFAHLDDGRTDFEKFKSLLRFISSLRERELLNDEQMEELIRHATAILVENEIEMRFKKVFEEGFKFDREKQEW